MGKGVSTKSSPPTTRRLLIRRGLFFETLTMTVPAQATFWTI
jgi:hypothetical protein